MLQQEAGPLAIFEKIRARVNRSKHWESGSFRDGYFCFYCLSIWVSIFIASLYLISIVAFWVVTFVAALSAIAIFIQNWQEQ